MPWGWRVNQEFSPNLNINSFSHKIIKLLPLTVEVTKIRYIFTELRSYKKGQKKYNINKTFKVFSLYNVNPIILIKLLLIKYLVLI